MVSHLSGERHGGPNVSRPLGTKVTDSAAVLAVPVGKQLDTPPLGGSLESLSFGDGDDIDDCSLGGEVGNGDLGSEDGLGVLDPLAVRTSADPELHEVGDLLGDSAHELGLGVCEDADVVDVDVVEPGEVGGCPLGDVYPPVKQGVDVSCPDLAGGPEAEDVGLVEPDCCDLHGRHLDDGDGSLDFHTGGGALCSLIYDKRVGHSCLVSGESLNLRGSLDLGPGV